MEKINFQNDVTKASAEVFNTMQDNIENAIIEVDLVDEMNPVKAGYKIKGKDVYVKRISGVLSGSGSNNIQVGLIGEEAYTPISFDIFFNSGSVLFNGNTPRGNGSTVQDSQMTTYWAWQSDNLVVISNGFDRTGQIIYANLYFYYN